MRKLLLVAISTLLTLAPAQSGQDPDTQGALAASKKRMENALAKTAALQDTAFTARWGPAEKAKPGNANPFAALLAGRSSGKASGSWHPRLSLCKFDDDQGDELITAGRRTIARSDNHDWAVRSGRFADGNTIGYVPDIEMLLQQLDDWNLAVMHREVGSIDDRPVEIVTVTLNQDQVAEAVWGGGLPSTLVTGFAGNVFRLAIGGMGGGRQAAARPKAIVDVAIAIDPATSLVHRLQFRAYTDENAGAMGGMGGAVIIQRGGGIQIGGQEEHEEEEEVDEDGPMQFEDGLPKRPRKKKSVSDFTVRLLEHGVKTAPGLSESQQQLLRVK